MRKIVKALFLVSTMGSGVSAYAMLDKELIFVYDKSASIDNFDYELWKKDIRYNSTFNGTNEIYKLLKRRYGLNIDVSCKKYKSNTYSDYEFNSIGQSNKYVNSNKMAGYSNVQKLGDIDSFGMEQSMSLSRDIQKIMSISIDLNDPSIQKDTHRLISDRESLYKFVGKSCGAPFTEAFKNYVSDFSEQVKLAYQIKLDKIQEEELKAHQAEQQSLNEKVVLDQQARVAFAKQKTEKECRVSRDYKLYETANRVVIARNSIKDAKAALAKDDQAARIGGVSNMTLRYRASSKIVSSTDLMNQAFIQYKNIGGFASSPNSVPVPKSPCW